MRILILVLALFCAVLPAAAQEPAGTINAVTNDQQDADIAVRIRDILAELETYPDVTVAVNEGVVTFRGTATSLAEADALDALATRVEGVVAVRNRVTETSDVAARLNPAMERFRSRLSQVITALPLALIAVGLFAIIVVIGFGIARLRQPWDRLAPNDFIADIYRQLIRVAFVILGLVVALDVVNATALLSTILGAAGIIGLAIGFAVRDTVENFIASIMLSIRQPFRPNDAIEINGDEGKVIRLTSRATILLSWDGNHIRIPNATVFKSRIVNFTRNAERRIRFEIGVASDADLSAVRDLAESTIAALPFTLAEPAPLVWIDRIGDGAVFLCITGWIDQRETSLARAQGEALRQVKRAIEDAGVEVPDTTYRIQMLDKTAGATTGQMAVVTATDAPQTDDDVTAVSEHALDAMIDSERAETQRTDLLKENGAEE